METTKTFLPAGYELKEPTAGNYLRIKEGETIKIRILTNSIVGYEYFKTTADGWLKPVRQKEAFNWTPADSKDGRNTKEFWAFVVYNYNIEAIQIWELTQQSIKKDIFALYNDADFGDPKEYDLKISRTGKDLDTTYTIMPLNKTPFNDTDIIKQANAVRLEALYDGDDPFKPF